MLDEVGGRRKGDDDLIWANRSCVHTNPDKDYVKGPPTYLRKSKWLKDDIFRPSYSDYASPVVLVKLTNLGSTVDTLITEDWSEKL